VLQVFDTLGMGGAETWLLELLRWFRSADAYLPVHLETEICITSGERGRFDTEAESLGATLHYVRYRRRRLGRFANEFRQLLATRQYDALHDHQGLAAGIHLVCGLGMLPRIRVVHFHNPAEEQAQTLPRQAICAINRAAVARLASFVAGTSQHVLNQHGFPQEARAGVRRGAVHCGFDTQRFNGDREKAHIDVRAEFSWPRESKILLFVGRLESHFNQKNPAFALDVVRASLRRNEEARGLFVGGGESARLEFIARVAEWGLSDRIHFAGTRGDVPRLMLGSDLLLLPSIAEGLGMVAVESQAAGTPVLASDSTPGECRVVPDLVSFMPLSQNAESWANRVIDIIDSGAPVHSTALDLVGRSSFSIANSASALLSLYCDPEGASQRSRTTDHEYGLD
jgi:glycosyltransferase involved in cell wall biosynthesis